jgi:ADP-dependent NAD(P)H-hydrate dehydratase / NAD(P)H-hydrate epimerase
MVSPRIKKRKRDTHKGDYGHVLVIAGSLRMTGAAYLSCEAALVSGAGLVTLAIPKSLNPVMQRKLIEVMTLPLPETKDASLAPSGYDRIMGFTKKIDCVLIGPGLSQNKHTQVLARSLIKDIKLPLVIDADALNALKGHLDFLRYGKATVITPHPGEMARLTGRNPSFIKDNKKDVAKRFAGKYNVTTVLKGYRSVVASPEDMFYVNTTGNPGMASAGCGDVLSGIIAALSASGMTPFRAARLGVYVHGLAGDMAAGRIGEISLRARDLLAYLPKAFKKLYR